MLLSCHIRYFTVPNLCHLAPLWAYYIHFSIFRLQLFYYNYNIIWRFIVNYQLELKQIVDFPRCRIYREFIQTLMKDRSIRTNGGSCLFYFLILCSYANYSSSYRNIEHLTYKVVPGGSESVLLKNYRFTSAKNSSTRSYPYWIPWLSKTF